MLHEAYLLCTLPCCRPQTGYPGCGFVSGRHRAPTCSGWSGLQSGRCVPLPRCPEVMDGYGSVVPTQCAICTGEMPGLDDLCSVPLPGSVAAADLGTGRRFSWREITEDVAERIPGTEKPLLRAPAVKAGISRRGRSIGVLKRRQAVASDLPVCLVVPPGEVPGVIREREQRRVLLLSCGGVAAQFASMWLRMRWVIISRATRLHPPSSTTMSAYWREGWTNCSCMGFTVFRY